MKKHFAMAFVAISALIAAPHHGAIARPRTTSHPASQPADLPETNAWVGEKGAASYYSDSYDGRRTSSGTRFDQKALTAAHSWLPFGTKIRVTLAKTGNSVIVTVTDRLYSERRIVDLSRRAAKQLGILRQGVAEVSLQPV